MTQSIYYKNFNFGNEPDFTTLQNILRTTPSNVNGNYFIGKGDRNIEY